MPYCARCGVEVDAGVDACPLCSAAIPTFDDLEDEAVKPRYPSTPAEPVPVTPHQIRMTIWAVVTVIAVASFLVVLTVNLLWTGGSITWGSFALASIGLLYAIGTTTLLLFKRPWVVVLSAYPSVAVFLALIDIFDGGLSWYLPLGLPLASATFLVPMVSIILWMFWKDRGANQLAILICLIGVECFGIDLAASGYLGDVGLSWSFVTAAVLFPLAGFLFVYHYVLRRFLKLRRFFHY